MRCAVGLLGWLVSESGGYVTGTGGHAWGARRRRALMLPISGQTENLHQ